MSTLIEGTAIWASLMLILIKLPRSWRFFIRQHIAAADAISSALVMFIYAGTARGIAAATVAAILLSLTLSAWRWIADRRR